MLYAKVQRRITLVPSAFIIAVRIYGAEATTITISDMSALVFERKLVLMIYGLFLHWKRQIPFDYNILALKVSDAEPAGGSNARGRPPLQKERPSDEVSGCIWYFI